MTAKTSLLAMLTVIAMTLFGILSLTGVFTPPAWLLWGMMIGAGHMIYTKVRHNDETETISLMGTAILLAILNLSWPEIALATIIGAGFGSLLQPMAWYKRIYNTFTISIAGIITEIVWAQADGFFHTTIGAAMVFDAVLYTLLVPIWFWKAKQTWREIHESYWMTFYTVPLSALIAITINEVINVGVQGVVLCSIAVALFLRPEYEYPKWATRGYWTARRAQ